MFKLPHDSAHFTCQQGNDQNHSSQASTVHELRTSRVQTRFRKGRGTRYQITNTCWIIEKAREFQKNIYFCFADHTKAFDCVDHIKQWKILQEMGIPDHLICPLRNLYARSRSNNQNQTSNKRLVQNWERNTPSLYFVTAQLVKNPPAMQETLVQFLGQEDPLEKGQATHSSILGLPLWLSL